MLFYIWALGCSLVVFVLSFLQQQVASCSSSAFTKCSGLAQILSGLEGRGCPSVKPMAKKVKAKAKSKSCGIRKAIGKKTKPKPKAGGKRKYSASAAPASAALATSAASASAAPASALPPAADLGPGPEKPALSNSRNCVRSMAYHEAEQQAKKEGFGPRAGLVKLARRQLSSGI